MKFEVPSFTDYNDKCKQTADKPARRAASQQTANFQNSHVTITTPLLWVICHPVARINIACMCTKFDDFRFSRSSNMIGVPPKILMGHMT